MSVNFSPAILGLEMAAPILWAPGICWLFLQEQNFHAHKTPRFWGVFGFLLGGGSANFILMGMGIFLNLRRASKGLMVRGVLATRSSLALSSSLPQDQQGETKGKVLGALFWIVAKRLPVKSLDISFPRTEHRKFWPSTHTTTKVQLYQEDNELLAQPPHTATSCLSVPKQEERGFTEVRGWGY